MSELKDRIMAIRNIVTNHWEFSDFRVGDRVRINCGSRNKGTIIKIHTVHVPDKMFTVRFDKNSGGIIPYMNIVDGNHRFEEYDGSVVCFVKPEDIEFSED